jgi:hypothetical protein
MRIGVISTAALLCALPASGQNVSLPQPVIDALTPIDSIPSAAELDNVFAMPLDELRAIALDPTVDTGIAIRAIRALPVYCPPAPDVCGSGTVVHDALVDIIESYQGGTATPQELMRLRAAVEALGATRSGLGDDVATLSPLLQSGSRDLRVTVVHALRTLCSAAAIAPLNDRYMSEPLPQVKLLLVEALRDLHQCN